MGLLSGMISDYQDDLARIPGITTGIVKENWEEEHPGMVKVEMFLGEQGKNVTGWVPVMTSYAGAGYGHYCLPEVGQEVVIGFHFGERNYPIVLGCLWDKTNTLPEETANENNTIKRFTTKGGSEVVFCDEEGKEKITVTTPGKLSAVIDDENKVIQIKDENEENSIQMNCEDGSITLQAKSKMEFKIGSNAAITIEEKSLTLKSKAIDQQAEQKLSLSGQNINAEGKSGVDITGKSNVSIKANSSLKLNSSGTAELKGSMVQIN